MSAELVHISDLAEQLTDKQRIFCEHYIQCWNATEAARRAGYKGDDNTLGVVGFENLRKPKIEKYISARVNEVAMSADEVLQRLTEWGRGSVAPFLQNDDFSEGIDLSSDEAKANLSLIKKVKQRERVISGDEDTVLQRNIEIELHDAKDAVDKLARIRGMYNDSLDITSKGEQIQGSPIIVANADGPEPDEL